jgi:hypothetical protein
MNRKKDAQSDALSKEDLEHELVEGLVDTFPASGPPTATQPVHHRQHQQKKH